MRIQRFIWLLGRILFYAILFLVLIVVIFALSQSYWRTAMIAMVILMLTIYKGLVCLKIPAKSVVVRDGKVVFFIPETTVRNRFDFVTRGQSIVELPDYQILDRPFKVELFSPGREDRISSCRLSLRLGYLMLPAAWQNAYDCFVKYQEGLSMAVRKLLLQRCEGMVLHPFTGTGDDARREFLAPVVTELNLVLANFGLELVGITCSFAEGSSLARLVAAEQDIVEKGEAKEVFRWQLRDENEVLQNHKWALLGVSGKNEL